MRFQFTLPIDLFHTKCTSLNPFTVFGWTTYVPQSTLGNLHHLLFIVLSALHVLLILIFLMAFYVRLFLKKTTKQTLKAFCFFLFLFSLSGSLRRYRYVFLCIIMYKIFIEKVPFIAILCVRETFGSYELRYSHV